MTTRKMWAPNGWENPCVSTAVRGLYLTPNRSYWEDPVEVQVTTVDHARPDFEPGDRVRLTALKADGEVLGYPFQLPKGYRSTWIVPVTDHKAGIMRCVSAEGLTKLPREKTVTLRVTGLEEAVDRFVSKCDRDYLTGIRVERVEER